jgi:NOL1/NOP2/fmu family ribosome biogenesis protein|tara:strand:+ start:3356 stop:3547 length:192 start_codon:yes stop_codon:yes gene_type:complete
MKKSIFENSKLELTCVESDMVKSALESHKERFNKWINGKIDEKDKQSAIRYVSDLDSIINKLK